MYKLNANQSCLGQKCVAVCRGQGRFVNPFQDTVCPKNCSNGDKRRTYNKYHETKVISLTNHNRRKQCNEPIRTRSKYMQQALSAGKHARARHD